jgi:hypothetical protein
MSTASSLVNVVLATTVVGLGAAHFFGATSIPSSSTAVMRANAGHAHKADRLPLFQSTGPSVTVSTPNVRAHGTPDVGVARTMNTTIAQKNVFVVSWPVEAPAMPSIEVRDPRKRAQPASIEASTRPREERYDRVANR